MPPPKAWVIRFGGDILTAADYGVPQTRKGHLSLDAKPWIPGSFFRPERPIMIRVNMMELLFPSMTEHRILFPTPNPGVPSGTLLEISPSLSAQSSERCRLPLTYISGGPRLPESLARYKAIPKEGMNRFDLQRNAPEITPKCWINKKVGAQIYSAACGGIGLHSQSELSFISPKKGDTCTPFRIDPLLTEKLQGYNHF